jgi:hypothetical protein
LANLGVQLGHLGFPADLRIRSLVVKRLGQLDIVPKPPSALEIAKASSPVIVDKIDTRYLEKPYYMIPTDKPSASVTELVGRHDVILDLVNLDVVLFAVPIRRAFVLDVVADVLERETVIAEIAVHGVQAVDPV